MIVGTVLALFVLAAMFVPLERRFALQRDQRILRTGWGTDVVHFLVNPFLRVVAVVVVVGPFVLLADAVVPDAWQAEVTGQPVAIQLVEALAIVVVGNYWAHRLAHDVPFLWRFHRVHHSSGRLDWLAATHLHPLDTAFTLVLPVVPLAVLDHANVRWSFGPLRRLLPNPQWHHWHHSNDPSARDRNSSVGAASRDAAPTVRQRSSALCTERRRELADVAGGHRGFDACVA